MLIPKEANMPYNQLSWPIKCEGSANDSNNNAIEHQPKGIQQQTYRLGISSEDDMCHYYRKDE